MARKKFPIGVQSFEVLRTENYVYVDKTALIFNLVRDSRVYFLSRPRRFGKSLLLSTIEAYFKGKKELFKGLEIEKIEKDWIEYPVFRFDMISKSYNKPEDLIERLDVQLLKYESVYGRNEAEKSPDSRFGGLIQRAYAQTGRKVVVLVDEYDAPLQLTLNNQELNSYYRSIFKGFYGNLKTYDEYVKFAFLTGVSKFGKVSVFSDLNNLKDISMDERYINICGITEAEMHHYFDEDLHDMAVKNEMTYEELCARLKEKYDGYNFNEDCEHGLYNPFSLLSAIDSMRLDDFWFNTGTPTFLVEMLKNGNYNMIDVEKVEMTLPELSNISVDSNDPIQILYQTGYLTIKSYNKQTRRYSLGFPNEEVKMGFYYNLAPVYIGRNDREFKTLGYRIADALIAEDVDALMQEIHDFLPEISYIFHDNQKRPERHFQEIIYILILSSGMVARVEEMSPKGRSDIVVETNKSVFVFELKMNKNPQVALQQIDEKLYIERYRKTGKNLYSIGVDVDMEKRNVERWSVLVKS